jgi:type I restriction enzyme S subunit
MTGTAPATWNEVRLDQIGQTFIGLTYNPDNVNRSGTLVLRSSNIQNGRLVFDDNVFVNGPIPERIRVRENDILICVRNGSRRLIGKSVMLDRRVVGQTFGAFMAVYRSGSNPFLQYFFQSDDFKRQIDEHLGATINQITNHSLNGFVVALPSDLEQKEIASRLVDVDRYLAALERMLAKKEAMKRGMMQQLLTGKTRLPGFNDAWDDGVLADVARIKTGSRNNQDNEPGGIYPFFVRSATVERINSYSYDCEAILVPGEGGIGSIFHYVNGRFEVHQRVYAISDFSASTSGRFIYHYMRQFFGAHAMEHSVKATVDSLRLPTFRNFALRLPSHDEQVAIAAVLDEADAEIDRLHKRLAKTRSIKRGMTQELLTGRTRLPVNECAA